MLEYKKPNYAVIFTKENCEYCIEAKHVFKLHNIPFVEYKLHIDYDREELLEYVTAALNEAPEKLTVPQIFLYGVYIGGCIELKEHLEMKQD